MHAKAVSNTQPGEIDKANAIDARQIAQWERIARIKRGGVACREQSRARETRANSRRVASKQRLVRMPENLIGIRARASTTMQYRLESGEI
jgi:hypothetical protein